MKNLRIMFIIPALLVSACPAKAEKTGSDLRSWISWSKSRLEEVQAKSCNAAAMTEFLARCEQQRKAINDAKAGSPVENAKNLAELKLAGSELIELEKALASDRGDFCGKYNVENAGCVARLKSDLILLKVRLRSARAE